MRPPASLSKRRRNINDLDPTPQPFPLLLTKRHRIRNDKFRKPTPIQLLNRIPRQNTMGDNSNSLPRSVTNNHIRSLDERAARIRHIVHDNRDPIFDVADENHATYLVRPRSFLVDKREPQIEVVCDARRSLRAASIRTHNHTILYHKILPYPSQRTRLSVEVINRNIEESLDLTGVEVHGYDVVAAGRLQHIGHQFRGDGSAGFVLFVLAGVGEVGEDGGDAAGGGGAAGVD